MERRRKRRKPGIVYLSCIPPGYNVSQTTMFFTQFGQVGRVFLQPGGSRGRREDEKLCHKIELQIVCNNPEAMLAGRNVAY